ncbi:uncharacterized protein LOC126768556 [Nymphalis io]|uniref:uncharacterized protein LOC126768556 n=1 Tax=Inachis io TaxID=171585 RepID=UPI00216A526A|nr:uncharacterized protein LOC126768556 [Nymphalis io]
MATFFFFIVSLYAACAAPQSRLYHQAVQYQQINPLDYYLDNPEARNYYEQEQKQVNANSHNAPARLETLEPDSEVELIPGAQQPQQPPQQTPVAPNIPGLIPGQRVFIVHMPVPGYRPGTVGGYQPVYVVAAAPQANAGYPGYQNPVLLDPSGQGAPVLGYQPGAPGVQANPNLAVSFGNRPFNFGYQAPIIAYQPITKDQGEVPGALRLSQLVSLQGQVKQANEGRQNNENLSKAEPKNGSQVTMESKQQAQNSKPSSAQFKNKA